MTNIQKHLDDIRELLRYKGSMHELCDFNGERNTRLWFMDEKLSAIEAELEGKVLVDKVVTEIIAEALQNSRDQCDGECQRNLIRLRLLTSI